MFLGTFVNVASVVLGSLIGLIFHKNFPEKIRSIVFQANGLFTLALGVQMFLKVQNVLIIIFALVIGGILGELANLEGGVEGLSSLLKKVLN